MPGESGPRNEQLNFDEASEVAINMQGLLYQAPSSFLRSTDGFTTQEYRNAYESRVNLDKVSKLIAALPSKQPQRLDSLLSCIETYGTNIVALAYFDLVQKRFPKSDKFTKFSKNSVGIFEQSEKHFVPNNRAENGYNVFFPPSNFYMPMAHEIYERLCGVKYKNSTDLKQNMRDSLNGKKVLELAPGPGWFMADLKAMGAQVYGLDKQLSMPEFSQSFGLNIKQGSADEIERHFEDNFDLIISNNLLNKATVSKDEADAIIKSIQGALTPNGISIHSTQEFKQPQELISIRLLDIVEQRAQREDAETRRRVIMAAKLNFLESVSAPNAATKLGTLDSPVLTSGELADIGLKKIQSKTENGYFVFSFTK